MLGEELYFDMCIEGYEYSLLYFFGLFSSKLFWQMLGVSNKLEGNQIII